MYKYYLIYEYHDTYVCEFCTIDRLEDYLNSLKKQYKYDRDFRYTIIYGKEVIVMNNFNESDEYERMIR